MLETVSISGHSITLRRLTVAEVATVMLRSTRFKDDKARASSELLAGALSYGVHEAPDIGIRPEFGWGEAQMQRLAQMLGTGPWMELAGRIVDDNIHLGSLRGKSAAPSASAPRTEAALSTVPTGEPMLTTPAAPAV